MRTHTHTHTHTHTDARPYILSTLSPYRTSASPCRVQHGRLGNQLFLEPSQEPSWRPVDVWQQGPCCHTVQSRARAPVFFRTSIHFERALACEISNEEMQMPQRNLIWTYDRKYVTPFPYVLSAYHVAMPRSKFFLP